MEKIPFYDSCSVARSKKKQAIYLFFNIGDSRKQQAALSYDHAYKLASRILNSLSEGGYREGRLKKLLAMLPKIVHRPKTRTHEETIAFSKTKLQKPNENASLEELRLMFETCAPETRLQVVRLLSRRKEGRELLLSALHDPDACVRRLSTDALGNFPDEECADALRDQLRDDDKVVKLKAIESLGKIGDSTVAPALSNALNDPSLTIRRNAAELLSAIGDAKMISTFAKVLNDEDEQIQMTGIRALCRIGGTVAASALSIALKNSNDRVRIQAARALGEVGNPSVVPMLLGTLNFDKSPEVRQSAAETLSRLGDPSLHKHLLRILKDPGEEPSVRASIAKALGKIGTFSDIPTLVSLLRDPDRSLRFHSALALGELRDTAACQSLHTLAKNDRDPQVRQAAEKALEIINSEN